MSNNNEKETNAFREFEHDRWQDAVEVYHRHWENLTCQVIEPLLDTLKVGEGTNMLDVATGPGYVAGVAAKRGAKVLGVDFSKMMLAKASDSYPAARFQEGDAEKLPFSNETFDVISINFGMLHFGRPEMALSEAYRVVRSGGRMGFTVWAAPDDSKGFGVVYGAISDHGTLDVPLPPGPPFFRFSDPDESRRVLIEAGFIDPEIIQLPLTWRFLTSDEFFEAFYGGTARTGPTLQAQTPEALKAIRTAIYEGINEYKVEGEFEIPMAAMLYSAIKV